MGGRQHRHISSARFPATHGSPDCQDHCAFQLMSQIPTGNAWWRATAWKVESLPLPQPRANRLWAALLPAAPGFLWLLPSAFPTNLGRNLVKICACKIFPLSHEHFLQRPSKGEAEVSQLTPLRNSVHTYYLSHSERQFHAKRKAGTWQTNFD